MTMLEKVEIDGFPPIMATSINVSAENAVRTATISVAITGTKPPVAIDQDVVIRATGDRILTGYVRDLNPEHDDATRSLSIGIVSRTVDATECSIIHPTGEILGQDIVAIAREFDSLGIGIEADSSFPPEPRHKIRPGETLFSTVERRSRGRGILIHDTPEGKLKLATKPGGVHSGGLIYGQNIKSASASITGRDRYSEIRVRGQATDGTDKSQLRGEAVAKDSGVKRRRPLILRHEGETTPDRIKKRAEWQANRSAGNSVTVTTTAPGWRDGDGRLWTPNWLVYVEDPLIWVRGFMIIKSVTLVQDDGGTYTTFALADPRALGGENPRGETSDLYSAPGSIEAETGDE